MSTPSYDAGIGNALSGAIRDHWALFLIEGIAFVILGSLAILVPVLASVVATIFFGSLLLVGGAIGLFSTLRARRAPGFAWSLLSALVALAAGVLLLWWPVQGTLSLTAVLIAFLLVEGTFTILFALDHRRALTSRWGWILASGIVDVGLGVLLLLGLPGTALWALGLLVGIDMIFGGWAMIFMAVHARKASAPD